MPTSTSVVTQQVSGRCSPEHCKWTPSLSSKSLLLQSGFQISIGVIEFRVLGLWCPTPDPLKQNHHFNKIPRRLPCDIKVYRVSLYEDVMFAIPLSQAVTILHQKHLFSLVKNKQKPMKLIVKHYVNQTISSAFSTFHVPSFKTCLAFYISYFGCRYHW